MRSRETGWSLWKFASLVRLDFFARLGIDPRIHSFEPMLRIACALSPEQIAIASRFPIDMPPLFVVFPLVYESNSFVFGKRRFIPGLMRCDCFLRRLSSQPPPFIQIAMIPFEIDVRRHVNLDDRAFPWLLPRCGFVILDVIFEQLDVILAYGCCKQLAEICQRIMKVVRFANLLRIDNPNHPNFVWSSFVLLDQASEIDGVDQRAFAVGISADLYRFLDEGKSRTCAQSRCIDGALIRLMSIDSILENSASSCLSRFQAL